MAVIIRVRTGTAATWVAQNPVLAAGEPGYESDTGELKIGNGSTAWNSLPYHIPAHAHDASHITSGTFANARISQANVTQHQAALSIATSQLSGKVATAQLEDADVVEASAQAPYYRYEWTDFHSPNATQVQDPFLGAAINSGTQSATPPAAWRIDGVAGYCLMRSSTTANSGFRWMTANTDRIKGQAGLFFRAIFGVSSNMNTKTIHFGFIDSTTQAESVDGAYFWLAPGSMVCTPKTSNNSSRSSGATFTLTADTYYVFEIHWTTAANVNFKIKSLNEATTHLDTNITTDIPTSDARLFGAGLVCTSSGTSQIDLAVIDYMGFGFKNRR